MKSNQKKRLVIGLAAGIILTVSGCGTEQIAEKASGYSKQLQEAAGDENYAEYKEVYECFKEIIKNNISSPSTADFQVFSTSLVTKIKNQDGYTFYNVTAYVDAENIAGATVRNQCDVNIAIEDGTTHYKYKINSME